MIPNNNFSILPFYGAVESQDYKKNYAFGVINPLISPNFKLLPFQIIRDHSASTPITVASLISIEKGTTTDILAEIVSAGLTIKYHESSGYDVIVNPSKLTFPTLTLYPGLYYIQLGDGANTWYSDLFSVAPDLDPYIKLEYWDNSDLLFTGGRIDYSDDFRNFIYLQTEIGKPEYPFEEEVQERDGYSFIEKQVSEKLYKFKFLATEAVCDAIRVVRMHDYINIYDGNKKYSVENIIFEPKWQKQGNLAVVEVEFQCDTVVKKIGKGITDPNLGDFNNDFNNDYHNT